MILFLDLDGVLHLEYLPTATPGKYRPATEFFTHLPLFETVMREHPAVQIVVSSTWRVRHGLGELQSYFTGDIAWRIIGVTPELPKATRFRRQQEILLWLHTAGREGEGFVALDDNVTLFSPGWAHLCHVDPRTAFDEAAADKIRECLVG